MNDKRSTVRMRYTGKTGYHGLRHGKVYAVSIVSMWLFRVILSYIFVLQFHLGLTGVWFGMFIDWICRSLCFLVRFARGKWMEHKVI